MKSIVLRKAVRNPQHFPFLQAVRRLFGTTCPAACMGMKVKPIDQRGQSMDEIRSNLPNRLTEQELGRILAAPDCSTPAGLRDRAILELLGGAGLKVQDLLPLRVENLDLQISCVFLPQIPERVIPFGKRTRDSLMEYLLEMRKEIEDPSCLLFPGKGGKMLTRQAVWKIVKKYAQAAGVGEWVSPEDLRTSLALSLLRRGTDVHSVQSILGIKNAAMKKYLRMEWTDD